VPLFFTACEGDRLTPAADLLQFVDLLREAGHDNLTLELLPGVLHLPSLKDAGAMWGVSLQMRGRGVLRRLRIARASRLPHA
jgi:hypothetical protein